MKHGAVRINQTKINQSNGVGDSLPDRSSLLRATDKKAISNLTKKGWVLLHRQTWDDEDFPEEPFTEIQAWIWLFSEACFEDKIVRFMNRPIQLKTGQLVTTIRTLSKRFHWSSWKCDRYLRKLERFGKILRQPCDRDYTILTICKYEVYQNKTSGRKDATCDNSATTLRQPPRTNKEVKEDKELKENIIMVYDFYIKYSKRNPNLYKLTNLRKQKISARLKEEFTLEQMGNAIHAIIDDPFMMGDNKSGKKYIDIETHLFGSFEKTEKWIRKFEEK